MGRGRDRGQRRRGYDDDQPSSIGSGLLSNHSGAHLGKMHCQAVPALDATVKWFNAEKGFGFVELADGSGDAFLHAAVLEAAGHDSVDPGAKLSVQVGVGQKGRQITAVLAVDASTAAPERRPMRSSPRPSSGRERHDASTATTVEGTVKWFKSDKGFGFVVGDDGGKDVFVHIRSLSARDWVRSARDSAVSMKVVKTAEGTGGDLPYLAGLAGCLVACARRRASLAALILSQDGLLTINVEKHQRAETAEQRRHCSPPKGT